MDINVKSSMDILILLQEPWDSPDEEDPQLLNLGSYRHGTVSMTFPEAIA